MATYIAIDLGAESGRVIAGTVDNGHVHLKELHRFANLPVRTPDGLHWDPLRLYSEILSGLRMASEGLDGPLAGIGIDSWAVDYGLLDAAGRLIGLPYHYRDARTDGVREAVGEVVAPDVQFARTGIAQLWFNTLYQLVAQQHSGDRSLEIADTLLMIPDLLHYWLCGERAMEYTNASTTGMLAVDRGWAHDLLTALDLPTALLRTPVAPGTPLAPLRQAVRGECGLKAVPIIVPATHDTASAVAAVPVATGIGGYHAYISSGTWSLLGLELDHPITSDEARRAGFTNEGGVGGTYRFLTNIMGLWLVQECRRCWLRSGREWSYDELTAAAGALPPQQALIDVDDAAFLHPDDMPAAITTQLQRSGQGIIDDPVALVRAILDGLALAYRRALESAERLAGVRVETIHIVGGGARNALLCQLTADACHRPVLAGPVEATALGNILVQAMGAGELGSLTEVHQVVQRSTRPTLYEPRAEGDWDTRAARLQALRTR